ncbi:MAG: OB-fold nucleic acid binding domain-containing protein, partial [Planctomycetia bacterium]
SEGGPFRDLFDFCERADGRIVKSAAIEKLVKAGAMDCFGRQRRAALFHALPRAVAAAEDKAADRKRGQKNIFDMFGDGADEAADPNGDAQLARTEPLPDVPEWPELDRLKFEKEALDFYISSHPLAQYDAQLRRFRTHDAVQIAKVSPGTEVRIGGMITEILPKVVTKGRNQGNRWAIVRVDDFSGSMKCILWSDQFARFKDDVTPDAILLFEGKVEWREGSTEPDVIVEKVLSIEQARKDLTKGVVLRVQYTDDPEYIQKLDAVAKVLLRAKGACPVYLQIRDAAGRAAALKLGGGFAVDPTAVTVDEIELLLGPGSVLFTGNR